MLLTVANTMGLTEPVGNAEEVGELEASGATDRLALKVVTRVGKLVPVLVAGIIMVVVGVEIIVTELEAVGVSAELGKGVRLDDGVPAIVVLAVLVLVCVGLEVLLAVEVEVWLGVGLAVMVVLAVGLAVLLPVALTVFVVDGDFEGVRLGVLVVVGLLLGVGH